MKKVITYGSFDLFHQGHLNIIQRAKQLGDYLMVGVTTEHYDETRGKINIRDSLMTRIENIQKTGLVDEIIIESHAGQKLEDVQKYDIDVFTVGSDWIGVFDYLKEYCEVVYLERTKGVSSTSIREQNILRLGMIGTQNQSVKMVQESRYVSGVNIESSYDPEENKAKKFAKTFQLKNYCSELSSFFQDIDGVYINTPPESRYEYIKKSLEAGKHVLCETPSVMKKQEAEELFHFASEKNLILVDSLKTAYCTGFLQLVSVVKSGRIGKIIDIDLCVTPMTEGIPKMNQESSFLTYGTYALLPIFKLLGLEYEDLSFYSQYNAQGQDVYTQIQLCYEGATATGKMGYGIKTENYLMISGTLGYVKVESPWWETNSFEVCFDNPKDNEKSFYKFTGEGLRYPLSEFVSMISQGDKSNFKLLRREVIAMSEIMDIFSNSKEKKRWNKRI